MGIFKKKPYFEATAGEWKFTFYFNEKKMEGCYLDVSTDSGMMGLRIGGASHAYGYLLAAAQQGLTEQLSGYMTLLYVPAMTMTTDQGLSDDVTRAINKWHKRMEKKAAKEAAKTTEAQIQADEALLGDVLYEQTLNKRDIADKRKADAEVMKDVIKELG